MKILPSELQKNRRAFSLVEVALALGIMAFAIAGIVGLIPFGLTSFRQAMNNTAESAIVQGLTNEILLTDFSNLKTMANSQGKAYYFDADGDPVQTAAAALYTAQIRFTDLHPNTPTSCNPLNTLSSSAGTTALITITKIDKTRDHFSVVIGNNQPVNPASPGATW